MTTKTVATCYSKSNLKLNVRTPKVKNTARKISSKRNMTMIACIIKEKADVLK